MTDPLLVHEPIIIPLKRGPNVVKDGTPHWVLTPCKRPNEKVGWWCNTHNRYFAQRSAFVMHCKEGGEHAIARCCPKHGYEALPPKEP